MYSNAQPQSGSISLTVGEAHGSGKSLNTPALKGRYLRDFYKLYRPFRHTRQLKFSFFLLIRDLLLFTLFKT